MQVLARLCRQLETGGDKMIQIRQIKLPVSHKKDQLLKKVCGILRTHERDITFFQITKKSLDARKKPELYYVYTVEVEAKREDLIHTRVKSPDVYFVKREEPYHILPVGEQILNCSPVVIGAGPAGLFCGYQLAKLGYRPVILERGADVDERMRDVEDFWDGGALKENSNVQFGEGGAGTFSDGKLNTLVNDKSGRNREVLRLFTQFGAPENILYDSKPHIGTDILSKVVKNMRQEILSLGGEVRFHSCAEDFKLETEGNDRRLKALVVRNTKTGETYRLPAEIAVLAIGHSARDTFLTLKNLSFDMKAKSFAVGVRVEHSQKFINESQYGKGYDTSLPAASYKLTAKAKDGRGVYTFCMCPGGYVVNASSEKGRIAVNGMSYSKRAGENANSAVIVTVTPEDFKGDDVLSGMEFQRDLEEAAYREGKGNIPVQLFKDYCDDRRSDGAGEYLPRIKGHYRWSNVRRIFPKTIAKALEEGMFAFDKKIPGYAGKDAVLSGVESRTSSPVRIVRDDLMQSNIRGVYPCGEGAGYAGGITSAAMDGLKVTENIAKIWRPFDRENPD